MPDENNEDAGAKNSEFRQDMEEALGIEVEELEGKSENFPCKTTGDNFDYGGCCYRIIFCLCSFFTARYRGIYE